MTLRHLQIFAAVCKENSITGAADRLNMAQPSVSLVVRELEYFYGVKLFERMNRRLYITDAGSRLLGYADTIISQFNESVNTLKDSDALSSLRVGANVTIGETLLPGVIKEYRELYPKVNVTAIIENSKQIESLLLKNDIDLALVDNISVSPYFISRVLFRESMPVLCAPGYIAGEKLTVEELAACRLLLREQGSGTRQSVDQIFDMAGYTVSPVLESISSAALINAAKLGLGITVLSRRAVRRELAEGSLTEIEVEDAEFLRNHFVVYHKSKLVTLVMKNFIGMFGIFNEQNPEKKKE
ncbi:MAG: LysR family transcriptional regulator [Eubacteriales bacterium]|nr:LysR family transcriptional regulator [Eubacteriales bacterium]